MLKFYSEKGVFIVEKKCEELKSLDGQYNHKEFKGLIVKDWTATKNVAFCFLKLLQKFIYLLAKAF